MCTSFAVYNEDKVYYGMNFDTEEIDLKLKLSCLEDKTIFYFTALVGSIYRDIAGINSDGLFICTQAVEYSPALLPSCNENDWYVFDIFDKGLKKTHSISDMYEMINDKVIKYPKNPLYPDIGLHTILADKTGEAFILEEGNDTNITTGLKKDFIVMTNFANGDFKNASYDKVYGRGADRYICAYEYINQNSYSFGINEAFEVLRKTSQENTLCSIVFEPLKNEIYISFKIDLNKKWKISLNEKTIHSLNGFLSNNRIQFTNGEILVKDLISLYK